MTHRARKTKLHFDKAEPVSAMLRTVGVAAVLVVAVAIAMMLRGGQSRHEPPTLVTVDASTTHWLRRSVVVWDTPRTLAALADRPLPDGPPPVTVTQNEQTFRAVHRIWQWEASRADWMPVSPDLTQAFQSHSEGFGIDGITALAHQGSSWYVGTLVGRVEVKHESSRWQDASNGLPARTVRALSVCPAVPGNRVAAVGYGGYSSATPGQPGHVYVTLDGGLHWSDLSGNLPDAPVDHVRFATDAGRTTLFVAVNGLWYRMSDAVGQWIATPAPKPGENA